MKRVALGIGLFVAGLATGLGLGMALGHRSGFPPSVAGSSTTTISGKARAEEFMLTFSAQIDGSDRFVFSPDNVWNEHVRWGPPQKILINAEPWADLTAPPTNWVALAKNLDLPRAVIATRKGRDVISLETTAEGFDLYFGDTQPGAGPYEVTIAIPRK